MSGNGIVLKLVLLMSLGCRAELQNATILSTTPSSTALQGPAIPSQIKMEQIVKFAKKTRDAIKIVKQMTQPDGLLEKAVKTNFLHSLFLMANASAVTGTQVSRAAGTLIRGFVQDSFNLVSIGYYLPRLIFLDGPTQFIELLRLVRTNQLRIPQDVDGAIDTIINFASVVRESQISMNLGTPFLHFFPNVFRGAELLSTEVIYGVFSWLGPISPSDVSSASLEGLWNRWDVRMSTTEKLQDKRYNTPAPAKTS